MTFAVLRTLHAILGDALADIERVYALGDTTTTTPSSLSGTTTKTHSRAPSLAYASPPPSPSSASSPPLDFPSLDAPCDPASPSEQLTAHPAVVAAINRIVAAAGQMAATVQVPFLSLCDASMGYHLPSCLRLLEAAHVPELLRAGPLHVREIAARTGVEQAKLAHILRLLATHHLLREAAPDVFAVNRISSLIDTGKPIHELLANPERKYDETSGVAAFVGLCCDELYKSSAYLTEAVFPGVARLYAGAEDAPIANASASSPSFSTPTVALSPNPAPNATVNANAGQSTPNATASASQGSDPTRAPFNYAFGCGGVGYFAWLEGEGWEAGAGAGVHGAKAGERVDKAQEAGGKAKTDGKTGGEGTQNPNRFRLERFGKAMAGTGSWEAPGAVLHGFDWGALPRGSVVVDVGGGIGSTSMLLASAYAEVDAEGCGGLRFVIQDRPVVVEMGEKAWRAKCPELLDSGAVRFQVHDFFAPQPVTDAAVFLLRVVLHDWPDAFAQRILLRLREAATPRTRLVLADFVLPLACVDDFGVGGETEGEGEEDTVAGAEKMLAPAPLLANLGKASANAYWMDLTMQATFNGRERTLRETVALALSAGWKVVRVTKAPGSLFGHIVAVPAVVPVPPQRRARAGSGSAFFEVGAGARGDGGEREMEMVERASSRCGTPTFGSRVDLPSVAEARARFGGSVGVGRRPFASGSRAPPAAPLLRQAAVLTVPPVRKKKPSPLSVVPPPASPSPSLYRPLTSPRPPHTSPRPALPQLQSSPTTRRMSQAPLFRSQSQSQAPIPRPPAPPSPMSPRHPLSRRSSYAHLSQPGHQALTPPPVPPHQPAQTLRHVPSSPVLKQHQHQYHHQQPSPPSPVPSRIPALARRASHTQLQLPQMELRKRSGSIIHPAMARAGGGSAMGMGMGSLLLNGRVSGGALDFGRRRRRDDADGDSESADDEIASARASPTLLSARSVLAAAARIERGIPRSPSPDP